MTSVPTHSADDVARIAKGLTKAQRELLLRHEPVTTPQPISPDEFFDEDGPELFVELAPEERCPDTGCLLYPGEKAWFAGGHARSPAGSSEWDECTLSFNDLGLALRRHLQDQSA